MPPRVRHPGAASFVPVGADLGGLAAALGGCLGCDIGANGTTPVFGVGAGDARVVLVGEQPGDQEERRGTPFVGPAGQLLDRALDEAGIDRAQTWVTNAVKHFKFQTVTYTKRRIHQSPDTAEVVACRPWLAAELNVLRPELVVVLGATAAKALLPSTYRVTRDRGQVFDGPAGSGARVIGTIHPSAVLRAPDETRDEAFAGLVADLRVAAGLLTASET